METFLNFKIFLSKMQLNDLINHMFNILLIRFDCNNTKPYMW